MIVACYGLRSWGSGRLDYVPKNRSGQAAIVSGGPPRKELWALRPAASVQRVAQRQ